MWESIAKIVSDIAQKDARKALIALAMICFTIILVVALIGGKATAIGVGSATLARKLFKA